MRRAIVDLNGRLQLGSQAELAGFTAGQVVDVLVTRAGSLIVSLVEDDSQAIDLDVSRLPAGKARQAVLGGGKR